MAIDYHFLLDLELLRDRVNSFDHYPFSLPVVRHLDRLKFDPRVTFLVGENGSGKSTLLEAMAVALGFNAEGGSVNFNFATRNSHSELHDYLRIAKGARRPRDGFFLRAESFYNAATYVDRLDEEFPTEPPLIKSYGGTSLHEQSHGESFLALLQNRFRGEGLYLLDEPEAALSPQRQLAVLARIHELAGQESQFVIATHSPILLAFPHATIYECSDRGLCAVRYEDTEHYRVSRAFLENPGRMLRELLRP
jgi:predicted ATPase